MESVYQTGTLIPNSTQVPDLILDRWMAELSGAEFKIVMYVARRTYGFRRASDDISLAQMANGIVTRDGRRLDSGTGLNKDTVTKAVATLIEKGILLRTRHTDDRGRDLPSTYSINLGATFGESKGKALTGVGKSDPTPVLSDTGESENPTFIAEKSDPYESENPYPPQSENPTHNIQGDIQSEKQLEIQETTTIPSPVPEPAAVVSPADGEDPDPTLRLVYEIVGSPSIARSIIAEAGVDVALKTALWWPTSSAARSAKLPGAVFRSACRDRYADHGADRGERKSAEKPATRRYVMAPPPPRIDPEVAVRLAGMTPMERFAALRRS